MSYRTALNYRLGVGTTFGIAAVFSLVPSYLFGEILTVDPNSGFHRYPPLRETIGGGAIFFPAAFLWGMIIAPRFAKFDWKNTRDVFARFFGLGVGVSILTFVTTAVVVWLQMIVRYNSMEGWRHEMFRAMGHSGPDVETLATLILSWIFVSYGFPFLVGGFCGTLVGDYSRRQWIAS